MKPVSMSLKDWLVSMTAKELKQDEAVCNKVISWSYIKAKEATDEHTSIEISGFGKFLVSPKKLDRKIAGHINRNKAWVKKLQEIDDPEEQEKIKKFMEKNINKLEKLKTRYPEEYGT